MVDRFWQINKTGGSGTLTITFTYAIGEEPSAGESNLVSQLYVVGNKGWMAPFTSQTANTSNNTVTAPGITNFGPFTLCKSTNPLPIELISFSAFRNENNTVDLVWETASEINNDYFTIQRSTDLNQIEELEKIKGAGNSTKKLSYKIVDDHPLSGDSYYRLKQTDFDGKFTLSDWKHIGPGNELEKEQISIINIYPNPFSEDFTVTFRAAEGGEISYRLTNQQGLEIFKDKSNAVDGMNTYNYYGQSGLSPGTYYFSLLFKNEIKTLKLVKK
jgi:hypothetical protein